MLDERRPGARDHGDPQRRWDFCSGLGYLKQSKMMDWSFEKMTTEGSVD